MRDLRVQASGDPYRVFYAFDPRRTAILLIGDHKGGDGHSMGRMVPNRRAIYDEHLKELERARRSMRESEEK
jgi:hypothetical protein